MSDSTVRYTGPGMATLLTVLFVALKLTGNINWAWVWVLSPVWISLILAVVMLIVVALIFARTQ